MLYTIVFTCLAKDLKLVCRDHVAVPLPDADHLKQRLARGEQTRRVGAQPTEDPADHVHQEDLEVADEHAFGKHPRQDVEEAWAQEFDQDADVA